MYTRPGSKAMVYQLPILATELSKVLGCGGGVSPTTAEGGITAMTMYWFNRMRSCQIGEAREAYNTLVANFSHGMTFFWRRLAAALR